MRPDDETDFERATREKEEWLRDQDGALGDFPAIPRWVEVVLVVALFVSVIFAHLWNRWTAE